MNVDTGLLVALLYALSAVYFIHRAVDAVNIRIIYGRWPCRCYWFWKIYYRIRLKMLLIKVSAPGVFRQKTASLRWFIADHFGAMDADWDWHYIKAGRDYHNFMSSEPHPYQSESTFRGRNRKRYFDLGRQFAVMDLVRIHKQDRLANMAMDLTDIRLLTDQLSGLVNGEAK